MKLGLLLLNGEMKDLVATARRAEAAGFSAVFVAEVYRSAWVLLTAMAAATASVPHIARASIIREATSLNKSRHSLFTLPNKHREKARQ